MKIIKILVLVTIALMFNTSSIVIAQESAKDSTKNTLFKGKRASKTEKDNAAEQQEAKDVTTHNEQKKSAEDKNKESNNAGDWANMQKNDEVMKMAAEYKKTYEQEYRKLLAKGLKDCRDSIKMYETILDSYKKDTVSRYINDTMRLYKTIKKLTEIKVKAIHDLETKIAEAKKLPLSQLAPRLNACEAEYKSLGEGDKAFGKVKTLLDGLSNDLKLFNDVNTVLNSPYSVKSVNSALATIEVLKKNSVGCDKRLKELDKTATLLKEYESITQETRNLIDYVGDFLALFKKYNSKQIKNEIDYDSDLKTQLEKTNSIPYLKEQYDLFWKELEKGSLNSDSVKAFIQKVENK